MAKTFPSMTLPELEAALDSSDHKFITLVVGPRKCVGHRVRLTTRSGPVGDICCENSDGNIVGSFDRDAVRRWVHRVKC